MIRTALLVGASVIAAACVACTPKTQPAAGPPIEHRAHLCTDEDSFIKSVHFLQPGYNPGDYERTRFAAPPVTDEPLPGVVEADLRSAFRIAPKFFQRDVCGLDGVFVNRTNCDGKDLSPSCFDASWGFRSPLEPNKGKRYIAISSSNWTAGQPPRKTDYRHAPRLTDYSTSQLNTLLNTLLMTLNHLTWNAPPKFDSKFGSNDPANASGMTVLAVLAHELGHVRWYDWVEPVPGLNHGYNYDFSRLTCPDGSSFLDSWHALGPKNEAFAAPEWLAFGDAASDKAVEHATGPQIIEFQKPGQRAPEGSQPKADMYQPRHGRNQPQVALANSLNDLYGDNQPWASLLGSLSPTEDLVETYVLRVMTQASPPLQSLRLKISSPDGHVSYHDVVADLSNKTALAGKLACVSALSQTYP